MNKQAKFDVFMAHNSKDKPRVLEIADRLKQRGLKPWVDVEQIPPGQSFQRVIQQAIPNVKSAAIFFGLEGTGNWQEEEIPIILSQSRKANIPVIPVLLPGVDKLPDDLLFLSERNWVNFASSLDDIKALDQLEWGITGKKPDERGENNTTALSSLPTEKSPENDLPPHELALNLLKKLTSTQFKEVIFRYRADESLLNEYVAQSQRATELITVVIQEEGDSVPKLLEVIYRTVPRLKR